MRLVLFLVSSLFGNWPEGRHGDDDQTNLVPTRYRKVLTDLYWMKVKTLVYGWVKVKVLVI